MTGPRFDVPPLRPPSSELERALIDEFVRAQGYDARRLADLSDADRHVVLTAASTYASTKLMEIEARSHLVREIHGGTGQTGH